jgi:ABC-type multidrug transport system ATPase subunit
MRRLGTLVALVLVLPACGGDPPRGPSSELLIVVNAPLSRSQNGADQRLVMLATAFATGPRILLVDEPSSGMSGPDAERASEVLRRMAQAGTTLLLVEHNLQLVRTLAHRVSVLDAGNVIARGTPAEVARRRVVLDAYLGADWEELSRRSSTSTGPGAGSPGG